MFSAASILDDYRIIQTRSVDDIRAAYGRLYASPTLTLTDSGAALDATVNHCVVGCIGIGYERFGAATQWQFPAADCYLHVIALDGSGEVTTRGHTCRIDRASAVTISPTAGFGARFDARFRGLRLQIDADALTAKLTAITGISIGTPLEFEPHGAVLPAGNALRAYLPVVVGALERARSPLPSWWAAYTEQLLMVMFLCGFRHNHSHLLERAVPEAAFMHLRRAEGFIEANPGATFSLEALADVSGASAFSLHRAFKRIRGCSPMQFAEQVRQRHRRGIEP